jgi:hypothetical protein
VGTTVEKFNKLFHPLLDFVNSETKQSSDDLISQNATSLLKKFLIS